MEFSEIEISGAFLFSPKVFEDNRGSFTESFKQAKFTEATGLEFIVAQVNTSVSKANTLRGIHTADIPPGQAKYIMCSSGEIDDIVIDLRKGSPTFLAWQKIRLSNESRQALYIPAGLGHGFGAKSETAVVTYLCDYPYSPEGEFEIDPFDPDLGIDWGMKSDDVLVSEKDRNAPKFNSPEIQERLPLFVP
jgi:dTDP-4-dehydrorhamnose 3,5-epimerase